MSLTPYTTLRGSGRGGTSPRAGRWLAALPGRLASVPRRRWEPWRDAVVIGVLTHLVLVGIVLAQPHGLWVVVAGVAFSVPLAVGTLTVLHDAGHRMFSAKAWPNVVAVQLSTPAGLYVAHWTLKHKVHHKLSQVYPYDEATRSSSMVRMHPGAPSNRWQRGQHVYAWALYGLAWAGELRSQIRYVRTGDVSGIETPERRERLLTFLGEKALSLLVLAPYAVLLGLGRMGVVLVVAETCASILAAVVLVVGHINETLSPSTEPPGRAWAAHLVRTTASFSLDSRAARWFTGGLTHHLAHHLRPVAVRSELPGLHETVVQQIAMSSGETLVVYPTLRQAVVGHWRRLRDLGRPDVVPRMPLGRQGGTPLTASSPDVVDVPRPAAATAAATGTGALRAERVHEPVA